LFIFSFLMFIYVLNGKMPRLLFVLHSLNMREIVRWLSLLRKNKNSFITVLYLFFFIFPRQKESMPLLCLINYICVRMIQVSSFFSPERL
jgi:hypothetical protein